MTREQDRASKAFDHVSEVKGKAYQGKYATMAMKAPALLKTAGLVQTLEFIKSRNKDDGAQNFLQHLATQLARVDKTIGNPDTLTKVAREEKDLGRYMLLTREAAATMLWYRRFAQSVLKATGTDDAEEH